MCAMAREYDMPRLMHSAESWLVRAVRERALLESTYPCSASQQADSIAEFVRMLSLAREFKLGRFWPVCRQAVRNLSSQHAQALLIDVMDQLLGW